MADLDRLILPGITHWNHPAFFAYFGITGSGPGIVGELIAAALNVNAMLWRTSPAATELEERTLAWVRELIGLPAGWFGQITDTASSSTLWALAAAREAAGPRHPRPRHGRPRRPAAAPRLHLRRGPLVGREGGHRARARPGGRDEDRGRRRLPDALRPPGRRRSRRTSRPACGRSRSCRRSAPPRPPASTRCPRSPTSPPATACGCTSTPRTAARPALLPDVRALLAGCERADSLVFNPHKWLLTPVDCSLLFTSRPDALRDAFSVVPVLPDQRRERRHQPDGLRRRARPPLPRPQAVVRAPRLRRRRAGRDHRRPRRAGPRAGGLDRRRARLGAARAGAVLDRLLPPPPRRRGRRGRARPDQRRPWSSGSTPAARPSSRTPRSAGATPSASPSATGRPGRSTCGACGTPCARPDQAVVELGRPFGPSTTATPAVAVGVTPSTDEIGSGRASPILCATMPACRANPGA